MALIKAILAIDGNAVVLLVGSRAHSCTFEEHVNANLEFPRISNRHGDNRRCRLAEFGCVRAA